MSIYNPTGRVRAGYRGKPVPTLGKLLITRPGAYADVIRL